MKALALAHAYVILDRLAFYELQQSSALGDYYTRAEQHLKEQEGWKDFEFLCQAGAEREELLWILAGCEGLPGLPTAQKLFGWRADRLTEGLLAIERAATIIEKTFDHPFGILTHVAGEDSQALPARMRSYVNFARAAQRDFGKGAEWFLNIAKARLVIHVTFRTKNPHDKQVSGLITSTTGADYNEDAMRRWRHRHQDLVQDSQLDPHTTQTSEERKKSMRLLKETAAQIPAIQATIERAATAFVKLAKSRTST